MTGLPPICQSLAGKGGESKGAGGMRRGFGALGSGGVYAGVPNCSRDASPGVAQTVRVVSFLHAQLSLVLPCSGLSLAAAWPWLLLSPETAERNLRRPLLFQPIFSRVYLALSRVRPARLSVEQALLFSGQIRRLLRVHYSSHE